MTESAIDDQRFNLTKELQRHSCRDQGKITQKDDALDFISYSSFPSSFNTDQKSANNGSTVRRSIRSIFRRAAELPRVHMGPLTYSHGINELVNKKLRKDCDLSTLCRVLQRGIRMIRMTRRRRKFYEFKLINNNGQIIWKDGSKYLELDSVKDIRIGDMASTYQEEVDPKRLRSDSKLWITIIYKVSNKLKALHVVALNELDFNTFLSCICGLVKLRRELMESILLPDNSQFARIHWQITVSEKEEDEKKDTLSFADVKKLCDKFHIYVSTGQLLEFFQLADINHNGLLNYFEFEKFIKILKNRKEVNMIWSKFTKPPHSHLSFENFFQFLITEQHEQVDRQTAWSYFIKYREPTQLTMGQDGFTKFLKEQPYLVEVKEELYSKPLNHYFIASSHNTYLLGKQIAETPSVEGYIQVLQQGCRCVEIDIWDGENGPVVCHGFLTSAIPLKTVIRVIKKYAFITSPYPLIISLEINCNKDNQKLASLIMREVLAEQLYFVGTRTDKLPSPRELKHKILLKSKKTSEATRDLSVNEPFPSSFSSSYESANEQELRMKDDSTNSSSATNSSSMQRIKRIGLKKHVDIINDVSNISGIHGIKFRNFSLPESKTIAHCFSLNEHKVEYMIKDKHLKLSLDKHNRRYLMRVYPHVLRYKSSNFNPIPFWKAGVQMVATNWQTNDIGQQLNLAMFQILDHQPDGSFKSGYVLKPKKLLPVVTKAKMIPLIYEHFENGNDPVTVKIRILSTQLLPRLNDTSPSRNNTNSFVKVEFHTDDEPTTPISIDKGTRISATEASTKSSQGNGFNPIWDAEVSITLKDTDLTFIKFMVISEETQIASVCLKLNYLRMGYRHIPLFNMEGEQYIFCTLFIHTQIL
ncbi:ANL_collapsed_G0054200.mRNA.1.CDS.1 [Saccharomyces cerevisiae]|nr:ANL_HP_G0045830.mRNA.1.CDS.1 [Saccharomyces cerevisiae]CAI5123533.1 ANL_HP_G0113090.mRNA.1.CDS.1 [Saccharomyces cerevisiae]CAI6854527.1 ANL_HP_G0045830.mRNA.1.CDS.1 [Saccharomyces cerevisiae]CAI6903717.1 ANL_collapsed_G0054200.mRNA.1.CDS.1 [Saccharomyces cerevisiae]CAI6982293.1 ANL_HP_G0113090.mRNA.1.CDS.1 [Saccharomyces cerevisiae]